MEHISKKKKLESRIPNVCEICEEKFDEGRHCPRLLPCSHCFCSCCIDQLIERNRKSCPFCRQSFIALTAQDLGINRSLLDLVRYVDEIEELREESMTKTLSEYNEEMELISQRNKSCCRKSKALLQEVVKTNLSLRGKFLSVNEKIRNEKMDILRELTKAEEENKKHIESVNKINRRLMVQMMALLDKENKIQDLKTPMEEFSFRAATTLIRKAEDIQKKTEEYAKDLENNFREIEERRLYLDKTAERIDRKISTLQRMWNTCFNDDNDDDEEDDDEEEEVDVGNDEEDIPVATLVQRILDDPVKKKIRNGEVFAVQEFQGRRRYAKISLDQNLNMHRLVEKEQLPPNAHLLKYTDITKMVDIFSQLIFLELGVKEGKEDSSSRSLGKILIRLLPGNFPLNFFCLCSGERGPSYADSNLLKLCYRGSDSERVVMGDYEENTGNSGMWLIRGVDPREECNKEIYRRPWLKGTVQGYRSWDETRASQFLINTRDIPGHPCYGTLGFVESGLAVLIDAIAEYPNITDISIRDCGIVLSE